MPTRLHARLSHIMMETPNPPALADFYGKTLMAERQTTSGVPSISRDGRTIYFRKGASRTLHLAAFGFGRAEYYEKFLDSVHVAGVDVIDPVSPHWRGEACAIVDPDGNRVEFGVQPEIDQSTVATMPSARLQHVVFASTDVERLEQFYVEKLGFGRSDHVLDDAQSLRAAFLHTNDEHHAFAIFRATENRLDHHCYETGSWNDLRDWADHFAEARIKLEWGPGRHGAGNNLFLFLHDPDGNWLELSAELETLAPERELTFWKHEERTLNLWGHGKLRS